VGRKLPGGLRAQRGGCRTGHEDQTSESQEADATHDSARALGVPQAQRAGRLRHNDRTRITKAEQETVQPIPSYGLRRDGRAADASTATGRALARCADGVATPADVRGCRHATRRDRVASDATEFRLGQKVAATRPWCVLITGFDCENSFPMMSVGGGAPN